MIISLISQKGGVGKSALARLLAVEVTRVGWTVKIADGNPENISDYQAVLMLVRTLLGK